MGKIVIDMKDGSPSPKRGDLLQTAIGTNRERTWFVLRSHKVGEKFPGEARAHLWIERWWELEPEFRMRLFQSAERNGGQRCIPIKRYATKPKKKKGVGFL